MNTGTSWIITATPPTPNGDLHVGHLSGPYLSADIFRRVRLAEGGDADYYCYGDDNQSYVETTAARLGTAPKTLAKESNKKIQQTLSAFNIMLKDYAIPGPGHNRDVQSAFATLVRSGAIREVVVDEPHDEATGATLFESYYSGRCPVCLCSTKCGICEGCGHPNKANELFQAAHQAHSGGKVSFSKVKKLILSVEPYREQLSDFFDSKRGIWRPHILELADQLLAAPLTDIDISFRHGWGLPVDLPGWEDHVFNVWAEMGLGLVSLAKRNSSSLAQANYAQFLGYDNSYFFLVVHPVLHFASVKAGNEETKLVDFIYTNEFYNLDGRKFSTSQGHLIWGRDLLKEMSADKARFYLALNGPEFAESNFVLQSAVLDVEQKINAPLRIILGNIERARSGKSAEMIAPDTPEFLHRLRERRRYYASAEHFSAAHLARISHELLEFLAECWPVPTEGGEQGEFINALQFWAEITEPLMPTFAGKITCLVSKRDEPDLTGLAHELREFISNE